jgi:CheY-like chemotaxis protein
MFVMTLCLLWIGLLVGLLVLHWFVLGWLSLAISAVVFATARWDLMLVPKWFGALALFQLSYMMGVAIRLWFDERRGFRARVDQAPDETLRGARVLIVEDDILTATLLAGEVAGAHGEAVGPVTSVADALQVVGSDTINAAVLDVRLADGDVTPVALKLIDRGVPFVILSARSAPREITAKDPAVQVFHKPVLLRSVISGLTTEVSRSRRAARSGGGPRPLRASA